MPNCTVAFTDVVPSQLPWPFKIVYEFPWNATAPAPEIGAFTVNDWAVPPFPK